MQSFLSRKEWWTNSMIRSGGCFECSENSVARQSVPAPAFATRSSRHFDRGRLFSAPSLRSRRLCGERPKSNSSPLERSQRGSPVPGGNHVQSQADLEGRNTEGIGESGAVPPFERTKRSGKHLPGHTPDRS